MEKLLQPLVLKVKVKNEKLQKPKELKIRQRQKNEDLKHFKNLSEEKQNSQLMKTQDLESERNEKSVKSSTLNTSNVKINIYNSNKSITLEIPSMKKNNLLIYKPMHKWQYIDDFGEVQDPCEAGKILMWIQSGLFEGRKHLKVKREDDKDFSSLINQLPRIVKDGYNELLLHLQRKTENNLEKTETKTVEEEEMKFELSIENINEDVTKKLYKAKDTRDLEIRIVPKKATELNKKLLMKNTKLFSPNTFSELQLKIHKKAIKIMVHSSLLKIVSPKFMKDLTLIERKWREKLKYTNVDQNEIMSYEIETFNPEAVRIIIRYIYGMKSELYNSNSLLLVSLYKEAKRFEIENLVQDVLKALSAPQDIYTILSLTAAAEFLKEYQIMNDCIDILADCAFVVFSGMCHLQLGPMAFKALISHENIQLDEIQIFLATAQWIYEYEAERFGMNNLELEKEMYKSIRFCSMSHEQIRSIRVSKLEGILLDACFRKVFDEEWKARISPWMSNHEFVTHFYGGLFPKILTRVSSQKNYECSAWTKGHARMVNEAAWAVEVIKSKKGNLNIGISVKASRAEQPNLGTIPAGSEIVMYFDCKKKTFCSGIIGHDI